MPDLAKILTERCGIPEPQLKEMHVLLVDDNTNNSPSDTSRLITTAILVDRPIKVGVYAMGTAIKCPSDEGDRLIGRALAITRACHRTAWRFFAYRH